jgi:ribonuclease HII
MTTFVDKYELQLVEAAEKTKETHMYENPFMTRIRRTILFVQRHPTLCACAATAVITAKLTRDDDIDTLKEMTSFFLANENAKLALSQDMASFIDARGLTDEFFQWAPRLRQE